MSDKNDGIVMGVDHYGWQEIPGIPLEIGVFAEDRYPNFRVRWNEEKAQEWFEGMLEDNINNIGYSLRCGGWIE